MRVQLSIFDLLITIGMVAGIICGMLLLKKSEVKPSNKFLGLGILGFVWLNTKTLLLSLNLWEIHGIGFFPNGIELALPPLFYFYAVALIKPNFKFATKHCLHFIPFFLSQTYAIVVYIATMQSRAYNAKQLIADSYYFDEIKSIEEYIMLLSAAIYFYLAYLPIKQYKKWLSNNISDTQFSELNFLNIVMLWLLFICFYNGANLILNPFLDSNYYWRWQLSHLLIASLVYYLGLVGYKNSSVISNEFLMQLNRKVDKPRTIIDDLIVNKLKNAIEVDKVYLNPKLSLQELAIELDVNESTLSNTINSYYKKNFRKFINDARVEEAKRQLLNGGLNNLSLFGIAQECGFNSEASFYRIFKETTDSTPKQFHNNYLSARG